MPRVYVSIGSNVAREQNVGFAVAQLEQRYVELVLSGLYESEPVGFKGRPFYNLAAGFTSEDSPSKLVAEFRAIEEQCGRTREDSRFGPRTLDIDLLLYDDLVCDQDGLKLPRDEIIRHAFVLRPLAEIAGDRCHPVIKKTFADLWAEFDSAAQPLRRLDVASSVLPPKARAQRANARSRTLRGGD